MVGFRLVYLAGAFAACGFLSAGDTDCTRPDSAVKGIRYKTPGGSSGTGGIGGSCSCPGSCPQQTEDATGNLGYVSYCNETWLAEGYTVDGKQIWAHRVKCTYTNGVSVVECSELVIQ